MDDGPDGPRFYIVGGLHPFITKEGEKVVPVFEEAFGHRLDRPVAAFLVKQNIPFHAGSYNVSERPELTSGKSDAAEGVPAGEKLPHLLEEPDGEKVSLGTSLAFL